MNAMICVAKFFATGAACPKHSDWQPHWMLLPAPPTPPHKSGVHAHRRRRDSEEFIEAHGGRKDDVVIFGHEANPTTWRLAAMNLAIRGIDFNLGREPADTFTRDQFPELRADFILANPPFSVSDWRHASLSGDARRKCGGTPAGSCHN